MGLGRYFLVTIGFSLISASLECGLQNNLNGLMKECYNKGSKCKGILKYQVWLAAVNILLVTLVDELQKKTHLR
jgi:hypothetical protein